MKRVGRLWDELTSFENLYRAYHKARRGKRSRRLVARFEFHLERELSILRAQLRDQTYEPGGYRSFRIRDPKPRLISAAPFRDRVVHHAFCNVIEPIFERSFIYDSYACRKGKGTHAAINRYTQFARSNRYVLKCDVQKYFPSVDHQILKELLARKTKDPQVLWLAETIIDHSNAQDPVPGFFPGDDLLTILERPKGLPIGNQTSQFFANVYLNPLDHFVKESLRCRSYIRYCDDFVILHDDRDRLDGVRDALEKFLGGLRLWLHPTKRQISRVSDGLPFLGYRVWPDHRLLTREGVRKVRRRLRHYKQLFRNGTMSSAQLTHRIQSWLGHACHADTWGLRLRLFGDTVFIGPAADQ